MATQLLKLEENESQWEAEFRSIPEAQQDLHFSPSYFRIYEDTYGQKGRLFKYEQNRLKMLVPYIEKNIDFSQEPYKDIESVYGYGGPVFIFERQPTQEEVALAMESFDLFCRDQGYVTEFAILNPVTKNIQHEYLASHRDLEFRKEVACSIFNMSLPEMWSQILEKQRKAITSARKRGVQIICAEPDEKNIGGFHRLYIENMNKLGAGSSWHFPETYFPNCVKHLGREKALLLNAQFEGQTIASAFMVADNNTVYYHFSASEDGFSRLSPIPLILFDSMIWAKENGYKYFHFGGGRTDSSEDSLFKFKNSMCQSAMPIYHYKKIHLPDVYDLLVKSRGNAARPGFFPAYG